MADNGRETLFEPEFLRQLQTLRLTARKQVVGRQAGERRSVRRGQAVEFADFRNYAPGDDFRHVDWNAYARLERLFLKLYMEEQETTVTICLDASRSMDWGEPNKFRLARQLAGALGFLALAGYDRVGLAVCTDTLVQYVGPLRGRASVWRLFDDLVRLRAQGATNLKQALRGLSRHRLAPGLSVVISDCLAPLEFLDGLGFLQASRQEVTLVQVLSPDEIDPEMEGDLRLLDAETRAAQEVAVGPALLEEYRRRLEAHVAAIEAYCSGRSIPFLQVPSTTPVADIVLRSLRGVGLVG